MWGNQLCSVTKFEAVEDRYIPLTEKITCIIQGDSGGKVNIMGGDSISHCGDKKFIRTCVSV